MSKLTSLHNAANELTRMVTNGKPTWYEYDEWGRRTLRAQGSHAAEYAYRYGDKLKGVVSSFPGEADEVAYIYDGLGKMRYRQVEEDSVLTAQTWYRYDLGWNVLGEYADHGGSFWWVDGKERGYVWDGMTALAAIEGANPSTGVASYYTHDHLGSTRGVYGAAGEVLAAVDYGPYGAPSTHNAGATPAFSYTGKPYDAATGLYHFPYRQYDPNAARWLTRDPLGMVDGPNVYAYVMGNPVGAVDPLGLAECQREAFAKRLKWETDLYSSWLSFLVFSIRGSRFSGVLGPKEAVGGCFVPGWACKGIARLCFA